MVLYVYLCGHVLVVDGDVVRVPLLNSHVVNVCDV